jgi:hypothetical protein
MGLSSPSFLSRMCRRIFSWWDIVNLGWQKFKKKTQSTDRYRIPTRPIGALFYLAAWECPLKLTWTFSQAPGMARNLNANKLKGFARFPLKPHKTSRDLTTFAELCEGFIKLVFEATRELGSWQFERGALGLKRISHRKTGVKFLEIAF